MLSAKSITPRAFLMFRFALFVAIVLFCLLRCLCNVAIRALRAFCFGFCVAYLSLRVMSRESNVSLCFFARVALCYVRYAQCVSFNCLLEIYNFDLCVGFAHCA